MYSYNVPGKSGHIRVRFDENDLWRAFLIAWGRGQSKRRKNVRTNRKDRRQDDLTIDIYGILAEMAVAYVYNATLSNQQHLYGDGGGPDHYLPNGETIETKYGTCRGDRFLFESTEREDFCTDFGVLLWPAADRVDEDPYNVDMDIVGAFRRQAFIDHAKHGNLGYNDLLLLSVDYMRSPQAFLHYVNAIESQKVAA